MRKDAQPTTTSFFGLNNLLLFRCRKCVRCFFCFLILSRRFPPRSVIFISTVNPLNTQFLLISSRSVHFKRRLKLSRTKRRIEGFFRKLLTLSIYLSSNVRCASINSGSYAHRHDGGARVHRGIIAGSSVRRLAGQRRKHFCQSGNFAPSGDGKQFWLLPSFGSTLYRPV